MKGLEVIAYTSRFNDLAFIFLGMVNLKYKKTERYVWGLASPTQGLVTASITTIFDNAKHLTYQLTKQCIRQGTMTPQNEINHIGVQKRSFMAIQRRSSSIANLVQNLWLCMSQSQTLPPPSNPYYENLPQCTKCNLNHVGNCMVCNICNLSCHTSKYFRKALNNVT